MQLRRDIDLLKNVVWFYSFIGIFSYTIKNKFLFFLIMVPLLVCICVCCYELAHICVKITVSPVGKICFLGSSCSALAFNIICLRDFYCNRNLWPNIFKNIKAFDRKIKRTGNKIIIFTYHLRVLVTPIFCTIIYSWYILKFETTIQDNLMICYTCFTHSQILVTNVVLQLLLEILEERFTTLKDQIRNVYLSITEVYWKDNMLKKTYLLLILVIKDINNLVSQRILLIFFASFFKLLELFQQIISDSKPLFIMHFGHSLLLLVSTF